MVIANEPPETAVTHELLARARAGDGDAFCRLTEPLQTRLLRQATALAGDLTTAEDLVSETLLGAWKSLARYNSTCRLSTWLYAILLHRYQEFVRRARIRPGPLSRLPASEAQALLERHANAHSVEPSPAHAAVQNEALRQVLKCIELLPEKHRDIVRLRFFEDASLPDMAAVLNCSVGTVKSRLHHALEKLRKMKMNLPEPNNDQSL